MTKWFVRVWVALLALFAIMLGFASSAHALTWHRTLRCSPIGVMVNSDDPRLTWALGVAMWRASQASGQPLRFDGPTDFVPSFEDVAEAPDQIVVYIGPRADTDLLAIPEDVGYTRWLDDGPSVVALDDSMTQSQTVNIAMHELMLALHIPEWDDGGYLSHHVPALGAYTATDKALLASTGCLSNVPV